MITTVAQAYPLFVWEMYSGSYVRVIAWEISEEGVVEPITAEIGRVDFDNARDFTTTPPVQQTYAWRVRQAEQPTGGDPFTRAMNSKI